MQRRYGRGRALVRPRLIAIIMIVLSLVVYIGQDRGWFSTSNDKLRTSQPGLYRVVHFDDGDTITVDMNGRTETIRFIGIDTPEIHDRRKAVQCYGHEAAVFTRNMIGNSRVRLEADPLNTNRDRYNRLLRYVYLPDGTFVNAEIVRQGYAFAYTSFPMVHADYMRELQAEAQREQRGLWSNCTPTPNEYGGYTSNDIQ
ncbi:hypothetical protein CR970_02785 [Candidatus Saccharibacteria bacterium]|nr:MAG: hypothetical protein CR970_02785 [Candidatus Saccharibacteria bacterium]